MYGSFYDILLLQLYLGSIVYCTGAILRFLLLERVKIISFLNIILAVIVSVILSLIYWYIIPMTDVMLIEVINIPALLSETTLFIIQFAFKFFIKKKADKTP